MKSVLSKIVRVYLTIGSVLALIMWATYMWSIGWGAPEGMSFFDKVGADLTMQPAFIFSALVRMILWLPSLIAWVVSPGTTTFVMWIAPGLYAETVTVG